MYSYDGDQWHVDVLNDDKGYRIIEIAWHLNHYFVHDDNIVNVLKLMRD